MCRHLLGVTFLLQCCFWKDYAQFLLQLVSSRRSVRRRDNSLISMPPFILGPKAQRYLFLINKKKTFLLVETALVWTPPSVSISHLASDDIFRNRCVRRLCVCKLSIPCFEFEKEGIYLVDFNYGLNSRPFMETSICSSSNNVSSI